MTLEEMVEAANRAQRSGDVDRLHDLVQEATALATPEGDAFAHTLRATIHVTVGEFGAAIGYFREAAHRFRGIGHQQLLLNNVGSLGIALRLHGEFNEALEAHHEEASLAQAVGSEGALARAIGHIATVHKDVGDYPKALEGYHRSLDLVTKLDLKAGMAANTGNLGLVYFHLGDFPKALDCYHKAIDLYASIGNDNEVAGLSGNIGNVYKKMLDFDHAESWYQKALVAHERLGNRYGVGLQHQNLGSMLADRGSMEPARRHLQLARDMYEKIDFLPGLHQVIVTQAAIAIDEGDIDRGRSLISELSDTGEGEGSNVALMRIKSRLLRVDGDLAGAQDLLEQALSMAERNQHVTDITYLVRDLRDLALERRDLDDYVRYNDVWVEHEIGMRGSDVQRRLRTHEVERNVQQHRQELERHKAVLYSTLPQDVAERVLNGEQVADHIDSASVLFLDIVGFTSISAQRTPEEVIDMLKVVFRTCDAACARYQLTKIKTIGDSYLAVAFPIESTDENADDHVVRATKAAIAMMSDVVQDIRIGLHCGPIVAGIVGDDRLQYDVWGDTVNVASRMESTGEPGRIQVSESFAQALKGLEGTGRDLKGREGTGRDLKGREGADDLGSLISGLRERGSVQVKGKGEMKTYWLHCV